MDNLPKINLETVYWGIAAALPIVAVALLTIGKLVNPKKTRTTIHRSVKTISRVHKR